MSITQEQRQNILGENRAMGWEAVPSYAPEFAKLFIAEHRRAILEKRAMDPDYLASYRAGAEKRSLSSLGRRATEFGRRLFNPTVRKAETLEETISRQAEELRVADVKNAKAVKLVSGKFYRDIEKEKELALYPSQGLMTADEREYWKRRFERSMGLRPQGV